MENTIKEQQLISSPKRGKDKSAYAGIAANRGSEDPLLRLRLDPLRCGSRRSCCTGTRLSPRHRRNAAAQAGNKIGARVTVYGDEGSRLAMDSAHPSAASLSVTRPRPIARVYRLHTPFEDTRSSRSSGDQLTPVGPKKRRSWVFGGSSCYSGPNENNRATR